MKNNFSAQTSQDQKKKFHDFPADDSISVRMFCMLALRASVMSQSKFTNCTHVCNDLILKVTPWKVTFQTVKSSVLYSGLQTEG